MKIVFCGHTGSFNRGCEAIVKSTADILKQQKAEVTLATFAYAYDKDHKPDSVDRILSYNLKKHTLGNILGKLLVRFGGDYMLWQKAKQKPIWKVLQGKIILTIGGDTYCYGKPYGNLALNRYAEKKNIPSALWGCSIEQDVIQGEVLEDLKRYDYIFPRECLTYDYLLEAGFDENKLIKMYDPAFTLRPEPVSVKLENTVGINISPLSMKVGSTGLVFENYCMLIEHILNETDMQIALIPHVYCAEYPQDLLPLKELYEKYKHTGRVQNITESYSCGQLKEIISQCRFFVGARTHATIAAYSSGVPTLVMGYSVKSRGIARDLFGTEENYVVTSQKLETKNDLKEAFAYIEAHEEEIRKVLQEKIPEAQRSVYVAAERLKELYGKKYKSE